MTTATRETPTSRAHAQEPSEWCGRSKHILLSRRGRKAREIPAMGDIFLLTFPFIEHILLSRRGRKAREIPAMGDIFLLTFPFIERRYRRSGFPESVSGSNVMKPTFL